MPQFRIPFSRGKDRAKPTAASASPVPEPPKPHAVKVYDIVAQMPRDLPTTGVVRIEVGPSARFEGGWDEFVMKLKSDVGDRYPSASYRRATFSHGTVSIVYDPPRATHPSGL